MLLKALSPARAALESTWAEDSSQAPVSVATGTSTAVFLYPSRTPMRIDDPLLEPDSEQLDALARLHDRPSRSSDGARAAELARLRALTPYERLAEAFELAEDPLAAPPRGG